MFTDTPTQQQYEAWRERIQDTTTEGVPHLGRAIQACALGVAKLVYERNYLPTVEEVATEMDLSCERVCGFLVLLGAFGFLQARPGADLRLQVRFNIPEN